MLLKDEFKRGIITENPLLILTLGLCPALAISTSLKNGLGMGIAVLFVLVCSNVIISLIKYIIPDKVRLPCYVIIIACLVTVVQLYLKAYAPLLDKQLGIYVPLIVVNCLILGRAEGFASKFSMYRSVIDGIVMGIGFLLSLCIISSIREILGNNSLFGYKLLPGVKPMALFICAPGGFFVAAFIMAIVTFLKNKTKTDKVS